MTRTEVEKIVAAAREAGVRADLSGADLRCANLRCANLSGADLRGANLREANLDYSCWPLWCGSLWVKVDKRIAAQIAYHFCRLGCDDPEYIQARNAILTLANQFHRVEECGKLDEIEMIGGNEMDLLMMLMGCGTLLGVLWIMFGWAH